MRILTGAPVPRGADAVVMQERARVEGDYVVFEQPARRDKILCLREAKSRVGEVVLTRGDALGYAELAMAAEVGRAQLAVTGGRALRFFRRATKWLPWSKRRGRFRFATATAFRSPRRWRLRAAKP